MQILSIYLKNIKSHRDTELNFSPGINVLSGPNGIGKSTIFEAIGYAMFGVDAQSFVGNVERFITIGARRGEIAVVFHKADGERFRVSRTVGTPSKWLLAKESGGDFEVEEHKDARETEARLKELLGLDNGRSLSDQFTLVIGPFQNQFLGPFVIKQASKRRDEFDAILGIDTWRKTFNETKHLASAIKSKVESLRSAIAPLKDQVAALPEKREAQKAAKQELEGTEKAFKQKDDDLKRLEARLVELNTREQTVKELMVEIDKLKERIETGKEKISSQKALVSEAEKAKGRVAENTAGKQAFELSEKKLAGLREQVKLQRELEREVASLDKQVSTLVERYASESRAIKQVTNDLGAEEQALADKRKELAVEETLKQCALRLPEIGESIKVLRAKTGQLDGRRAGLDEGSEKLAEGICPFFQEPCLNIAEKPPGDVFTAKFDELKTERDRLSAVLRQLETQESEARTASDRVKQVEVQIRGLDEQVANLTARSKANDQRAAGLEGLQSEQTAAKQALEEKQQALKAYSSLQADIATAEAEQKQHQRSRDLYVANQEQAAKLEGLQTELQRFEQFLAKLRGEMTGKEGELLVAGRDYDAAQHQQLREQKDGLGREVGALGQKVEGLKRDLERLSGEIDKLKQLEIEIKTKLARIKTYGEKEELVKFLRNRVFRNVSASLSERFREEISQRANRIYRIIAEVDEELVWGDNYQVVLRDMVEGELRERADDQLSGGQTMSAVVALRLAMLQTIGARIAFFDEPTSNLDATRRENLAHAFRAIDVGKEEVTEHWYDQLFLISHDVAFTEVTDQIMTLDSTAMD
ncbi:MAG TPA: SMC family ATPase [Geopsychrobacteraceae bacterium]|nr:SMC family ATPase [Geopsychrobacteraceae bacterium]